MMKKYVLFRAKTLFFSFLLTLVSIAGWGQVNITPIRTDVSGFSSWADTDIDGTTYLQLTKVTSRTISPTLNFDNYTEETLDFKARTYGGPTSAQATITVSISVNNGSNWTVLGTRTPTNTTLNSQTQFDLSAYSGSQIKIKFETLGAASGKGAGIDDITIKGKEITSGYTITVTQPTGGTITPGTTTLAENGSQTFGYSASSCYTFDHWVADGVAAGNAADYTFSNVTANHTLTAVFNQNSYNIVASAGANGNISPSGTTSVACGGNQTYTITPNSGYAVDDVWVDGVSVGAVTSYAFTNVTATHTISATFKVYVGPITKTYKLVTSISDLVAGKKYLIVNAATAGSGQALSIQNSNNRGQSFITIDSGTPNTISVVPASTSSGTEPYELTLGGSTGAWTLEDAVNGGFLYPVSGQNYLRNGTGGSNNYYWSISIASNVATIATSTNSRTIRYNSSATAFSAYTTGQNDVYLFVEVNTTPTPEINLKQGTTDIASSTGEYNFGNQEVSTSSAAVTFTIENTGNADLTIGTITKSGANAGDFTINQTSTTSPVSGSGSTTFTISFTPSGTGLRSATISIPNDDADESPYTFTVKGNGYNKVDYSKLDWPMTGTINEGDAYDVYIKAYEPGVTDAAGNQSQISAWVGYSTVSTTDNPNGSAWTWIPATFDSRTDSDTNYQYVGNLNTSGLPAGTYYYAARFQMGAGAPYTYGGIQSANNGGNWDGTTYKNGTLTITPDAVDYANIQSPDQPLTRTQGDGIDIFSRVYEPGITPGATNGSGNFEVKLGYSTKNPTTKSDFEVTSGPDAWTWITMPANPNYTTSSPGYESNNDEYWLQNFGSSLPVGTYYYVARYKKENSSTYVYGGNKFLGNPNEGGIWDGVTYNAGKLTINAPSGTSDIITSAGFTYPTNIPYINYQATDISGGANDIEVAKFTLRDGGTTVPDGDNLPTVLKDLTLSLDKYQNVQRVAIYDGVNEIAEIAGAATLNFTNLNLTAPDNETKEFSIRVSFNTTVTDNDQIKFTITSATPIAIGSSTFAAANASGAVTSVTGDDNKIEVTADRLAFGQQPTTTAKDVAMTPAVTVSANDELGNRDLDFTGSVKITSEGTLTGTPVNVNAVKGLATFGSLVHTAAGTNLHLITGYGSWTDVTSGAFDIVTVTYTNNDYRTTNGGTWSTATNGTATWEKWNTSTNQWESSSRPTTSTSNVYIRHTITSNGSSTVNSIIVEGPDTAASTPGGNYTVTSGTTTVNNGLFIKSYGVMNANNTITISGGNFEIEDEGEFYLNYEATNISGLWSGTEIFHPKSNFIIKDWDADNSTSARRPIFNGSNISTNIFDGYEAAFGNLKLDFENRLGNSDDIQLIDSGVNKNLAHGDLWFYSNTNTSPVMRITTTGTVTSGIGGDFIVDDNFAGANVINFKTSGTLNFTIGGDMQLDSATTRVFAGGSNGMSSTITIGGDLSVTPSAVLVFNSSSVDGVDAIINLKGNLYSAGSGLIHSVNSNADHNQLNFIGNTTQTIDIASTSSTENRYIYFTVKNGSYAKLINRNFELGTNSKLTVENGGILDFGFNGTSGWNVTTSDVMIGQQFELKDGGTLKITSPDGISAAGTSGGNVQIGSDAAKRIFGTNATYHYIGKANQVSGNGLPAAASAKTVIVEMDNNDLKFWATPESGAGSVKRFTSGGTLEIRRGIVLDGENPDNGEDHGRFADEVDTGATAVQSGNLKMTGGRYILYSNTFAMPHLSGTYDLTGGVIQFDGNDQSIRAPKSYLNVEVTGNNVGTPAGNITVLDTGTFTVKNGGAFLINSNSIIGGSGTETVTVENGGTFKTGDADGFSGSNQASIQPSINNINLQDGSTVEYSREGTQLITAETNIGQGTDGNYYNLKISGSGTKTSAVGTTTVNGMTSLTSADATLLVPSADEDENPNVFNALGGIENANGSTGIFRLANNAQLIQHTTARDNADNSNAKIEAQRLITTIHNTTGTGGQMDYVYWSAPVTQQKLQDFSPNTPTNRFFEYIESTDLFKAVDAQSDFTAGKGYAIRAENGITPNTNKTYTFTGIPNNGGITLVDGIKKASASTGGYNLIGNPYPSNIDADLVFAANPDIYTTAFFWTNKNYNFPTQQGSTYDGSNYAVYNKVGGNPATYDASMDDDTPTNIIKVGQGFIVQKENVGTSNFVFNNSMRITEKGNFYEKSSTPKDRFWITLTSPANLVNTMLIGYVQDATNDYEKNYDAESLALGSDAVYSVLEDKKLAIQGRNYPFDDEDKIPMGTNHYQMGTYTIALKNPEGIFANGQKIYLHDKLNDSYTDLSESTYQFNAEAGSTENRFEIVYQPDDATLATDNSSKENLWVYRNGENFVVKSTVNINEIEVYDVSGRLQQKIKDNTKQVLISGDALVSGMYVLKIKRGNTVSSRKILK